MTKTPSPTDWASSVYYAQTAVGCSPERAWRSLFDYRHWNPGFVGAEVTPVSGISHAEGEVVLIRIPQGESALEFYAETVKVVPMRHLVWHTWRKDGAGFRNFVDFALTDHPSGIQFNIYYYARDQLAGEELSRSRTEHELYMPTVADAFRRYCEG